MRQITTLPRVSITLYEHGAYSTFDTGASYAAQPHFDDPHYSVIAHRCGYGDDLLRYCREHEFFHHIAGEEFYGGVSPVVWTLAHGGTIDPRKAATEELVVMALQRWVRAAEEPIVGGFDWHGLRDRCLRLLDE